MTLRMEFFQIPELYRLSIKVDRIRSEFIQSSKDSSIIIIDKIINKITN